MDRAETVTLFNDLCVLAPAALVEADVTWTVLGPDRVHADFTRGLQTIGADLLFDEHDDLVNFVSDDRLAGVSNRPRLHIEAVVDAADRLPNRRRTAAGHPRRRSLGRPRPAGVVHLSRAHRRRRRLQRRVPHHIRRRRTRPRPGCRNTTDTAWHDTTRMRKPMRTRRVIALIIAGMLAVPGIPLLAAGTALGVADMRARNTGGYVAMAPSPLQSSTPAVVTPAMAVVVDSNTPEWLLDRLATDLRLWSRANQEPPSSSGHRPHQRGRRLPGRRRPRRDHHWHRRTGLPPPAPAPDRPHRLPLPAEPRRSGPRRRSGRAPSLSTGRSPAGTGPLSS